MINEVVENHEVSNSNPNENQNTRSFFLICRRGGQTYLVLTERNMEQLFNLEDWFGSGGCLTIAS